MWNFWKILYKFTHLRDSIGFYDGYSWCSTFVCMSEKLQKLSIYIWLLNFNQISTCTSELLAIHYVKIKLVCSVLFRAVLHTQMHVTITFGLCKIIAMHVKFCVNIQPILRSCSCATFLFFLNQTLLLWFICTSHNQIFLLFPYM